MRMDLHLQRLELCLGQLARELARSRFSFTYAAVIVEGVGYGQCGPVNRETLVKVVDAKRVVTPEGQERWIPNKVGGTKIPGQRRCRRQDNKGKENAYPNVD